MRLALFILGKTFDLLVDERLYRRIVLDVLQRQHEQEVELVEDGMVPLRPGKRQELGERRFTDSGITCSNPFKSCTMTEFTKENLLVFTAVPILCRPRGKLAASKTGTTPKVMMPCVLPQICGILLSKIFLGFFFWKYW